MFDRVIVVDWSAANLPTSPTRRANAVWIGCHDAEGGIEWHHRTRAAAEAQIVTLITAAQAEQAPRLRADAAALLERRDDLLAGELVGLGALLRHPRRRAAQRHAERAAIVDGALTLTYAELGMQAERVARGLIALGVAADDRVAIWAPNRAEWIVAACGVHMAGAVLVPINTRMKGPEAADILERSRAGVLFCIGEFLGQYFPALLDGLRPATLGHIVVIGDGVRRASGEMCWDVFQGEGDSIGADRVAEREAALRSDSTADLMFTSGTTGRPKGVVLSHYSHLWAISQRQRRAGAFGQRAIVAAGSGLACSTMLAHSNWACPSGTSCSRWKACASPTRSLASSADGA